MEEGKIFGTNHPAISWQFSGNLIVPPSPLSLSSSSSWRASDWILVKCRYEIDYNTPHVVRLCKSMFVAFAEETNQEMKSVLAPRALHCTTFKTSSIRWGIGVYLRLRESHFATLGLSLVSQVWLQEGLDAIWSWRMTFWPSTGRPDRLTEGSGELRLKLTNLSWIKPH